METAIWTCVVFAASCVAIVACVCWTLAQASRSTPALIAQMQESQRLNQRALDKAHLALLTHCDRGAEIQYANAELQLAEARRIAKELDSVPHHGPPMAAPPAGAERNGSERIEGLLAAARRQRKLDDEDARHKSGERLGHLPGD